jgi:hypothetical protein
MNPIDAALAAFYPVIAIMGVLIILRFFPLLRYVEQTTKPLICSTMIIVMGVMWEQLLYGYGRFSGDYVTIATTPSLVAVGKILYVAGCAYMLYAFWLLSPTKPRLWASFAFAATAWAVIFGMLML